MGRTSNGTSTPTFEMLAASSSRPSYALRGLVSLSRSSLISMVL